MILGVTPGAPVVYASERPSGDHDSALCETPAACTSWGARLRSAGMRQILRAAIGPERNASSAPSGDHTGQWLTPSVVSVARTPRPKSYTYKLWLGPSTSMANWRASGGQLRAVLLELAAGADRGGRGGRKHFVAKHLVGADTWWSTERCQTSRHPLNRVSVG
jgi:hypothetical protein